MKLTEKIIQLFSKKSLYDVGLVYAGSLLNGVSLFLINIFLGRVLEKDLFGVFTLSIMIVSTVAEMSDFGLNGGLLRFAPYYLANKEDSKLKQLVKTIWRWRIWLSVILTLGGIVVSPWLARYVFNNPNITGHLIFAFLGVGGVVLVGFTSTYLQASQRFLTNSVIQSLKGVLRLILVITLFLFNVHNVFAYLLIYILIPWLLFLFSYRYLPESFGQVQVEAEVKQKMHSQLARFSFWLTIASLSSILASRVDQIMLSRLMGLEKVAIYAMAFQFVYLYSLILQSVTTVLTPQVNSLRTSQELFMFCKRVFKWVILLAVVISLAIYPSKFVIAFLFGQKYLESLPIYLILSWSMMLNLLVIPFSLVITAYNQTRLLAISGFMQLIVNVVFNLLLIPQYGVRGAAYTFMIGLGFAVVYVMISAGYLLKYKKLAVF